MSTTLLEGHVLSVLEGLPAGHFHTCVTSPPYWQLRAYGTPPQVWDGPEGCEHSWGEEGRSGQRLRNGEGSASPNWHGGKGDPRLLNPPTGAFCTRCGAWRGELGQEPTPEAFVAHLVAVFSAVRRVLRDDGTLWVNLAGSYWSEPGGQNGTARMPPLGAGSQLHAKQQETFRGISNKAVDANRENGRKQRGQHPVYKPLDWVDVPGLFARAMQAAGWIWRSDVVWVKPSALPESVQGTHWTRCRVKVAKGSKDAHYSAGADAFRGPSGTQSAGRGPKDNLSAPYDAEWADCPGCPKCSDNQGLVLRRGSGRPTKATERVLLFAKRAGYLFDQEAVRETALQPEGIAVRTGQHKSTDLGHNSATSTLGTNQGPSSRNLRDWWVLSPEPMRDAHYAAFPSSLPERCIKAGTSEWGCCPACGSPWARVVERRYLSPLIPGKHPTTADTFKGTMDKPRERASDGTFLPRPEKIVREHDRYGAGGSVERFGDGVESTTLGWRPTCRCQPQQPPAPCRVLDPFGGSGTTALAANRLGRDCTLIELKPEYAALARKRVGREPLSLFATHGGDVGAPPPEEAPPEQTKQERHPNRTFARVPPLVEAGHRPVGGILPGEEAEGAVAGG